MWLTWRKGTSMKKIKTPKLALCKFGNRLLRWVKKGNTYVPMTDADIDKKLKLTDSMPAKERKKARKAYVDECEIVADAKISDSLEKAPEHVPHTVRADLPKFLRQALLSLLALFDLFPGTSFGVDLVGDILCGFRASSLRKVEPALLFRTDIAIKSKVLEDALTAVVSQLVFNKSWEGKGCKIKQQPVLDFSKGQKWHIDFSKLIVRISKKRKIYYPVDYVDTAYLICHADTAQRDDALKYADNSFHVLSDCAKSTATGVIRVLSKDLKAVDPDALSRFTLPNPSVAVLLRHWTDGQNEDWASELISHAKGAIGTPDSRYISVSYDPVILRKAVRQEVLLDFLEHSEAIGLLTPEEHSTFIKKVETAGSEPVLRKAEDPEVVISVVRRFIQENREKIAQLGETITSKSGHFGAWRMINQEDVLIFDEKSFFPWYRSQIKGDETIDTSIFKDEKFDLIILRNLVASGKIKPQAEGNPRYRYNLYAKGEKNRINVVVFYKRELLPLSEEVTADD